MLRHVMCCHTETEVTDEIFYVTLSDTGPTSPSSDTMTPGAQRHAKSYIRDGSVGTTRSAASLT